MKFRKQKAVASIICTALSLQIASPLAYATEFQQLGNMTSLAYSSSNAIQDLFNLRSQVYAEDVQLLTFVEIDDSNLIADVVEFSNNIKSVSIEDVLYALSLLNISVSTSYLQGCNIDYNNTVVDILKGLGVDVANIGAYIVPYNLRTGNIAKLCEYNTEDNKLYFVPYEQGEYGYRLSIKLFEDISDFDFFSENIKYTSAIQILNGVDDYEFAGAIGLTRGMLGQMIYNTFGGYVSGRSIINFIDVDTNDWYYEALSFCYANGIMYGNGEDSMRPEDTVTREELATIIVRAYGIIAEEGISDSSSNFEDSGDISAWASGAVSLLEEYGIINGYSDGTFKPLDAITRNETAIVIDKLHSFVVQSYKDKGMYKPSIKEEFGTSSDIEKEIVTKQEILYTNGYTADTLIGKTEEEISTLVTTLDTSTTVPNNENTSSLDSSSSSGSGSSGGNSSSAAKLDIGALGSISGLLENYYYTGSDIEPVIDVVIGDATLNRDTDYTISYKDNIEIGKSTIIADGKGAYTGTLEGTFEIVLGTGGDNSDGDNSDDKNSNEDTSDEESSDGDNSDDNSNGDNSDGDNSDEDTSDEDSSDGDNSNGDNSDEDSSNEDNSNGDTSDEDNISNLVASLVDNSENFTGSTITPLPIITYGDITLDEKDYTLSYTDNIKVGVGTILVSGKGEYEGLTGEVTFTISAVDLDILDIQTLEYSGSELEPDVLVEFNGSVLFEGADYSIHYSNNTNAGVGSVTASGLGRYAGNTGSKDFEITSKDISAFGGSSSAVTGLNAEYEFTGSDIEPTPIVSLDDTELIIGTDYIVSYSNNVDIGTADVTITGKGNYSGNIEASFDIIEREITDEDILSTVTGLVDSYEYTGGEVKPIPTITVNNSVLIEGVDYDITYENNTSVTNQGSITIEFKGDYTGSITITFEITYPAEDKYYISNVDENYVYTGSAIVPEPTIKCGDLELVKGTDYLVFYEDNTDVGLATIKINLIGNHTGNLERNFNVTQATLTADDVTINGVDADYEYTGEAIKPAFTVTVNDTGTTLDVTEYTTIYKNNTEVGTATIELVFKGNYTGSAGTSFEVTEPLSDVTVTFDTLGGTDVGSITVSNGSTVTKPNDPTNGDLPFYGWYIDDRFSEEFDFSTGITSDITLYAKFTNIYISSDYVDERLVSAYPKLEIREVSGTTTYEVDLTLKLNEADLGGTEVFIVWDTLEHLHGQEAELDAVLSGLTYDGSTYNSNGTGYIKIKDTNEHTITLENSPFGRDTKIYVVLKDSNGVISDDITVINYDADTVNELDTTGPTFLDGVYMSGNNLALLIEDSDFDVNSTVDASQFSIAGTSSSGIKITNAEIISIDNAVAKSAVKLTYTGTINTKNHTLTYTGNTLKDINNNAAETFTDKVITSGTSVNIVTDGDEAVVVVTNTTNDFSLTNKSTGETGEFILTATTISTEYKSTGRVSVGGLTTASNIKITGLMDFFGNDISDTVTITVQNYSGTPEHSSATATVTVDGLNVKASVAVPITTSDKISPSISMTGYVRGECFTLIDASGNSYSGRGSILTSGMAASGYFEKLSAYNIYFNVDNNFNSSFVKIVYTPDAEITQGSVSLSNSYFGFRLPTGKLANEAFTVNSSAITIN